LTNRCTQFDCLNICLLNNKLDDVRLNQCIDVLFLVETPMAFKLSTRHQRHCCDAVAFTGTRLQPVDIGAASDLDPSDGKSYRPSLFCRKLLVNSSNISVSGSCCLNCTYHSTETAVLRVVSDILEALDRGDLPHLTSCYFVDCSRSTVLDWFTLCTVCAV